MPTSWTPESKRRGRSLRGLGLACVLATLVGTSAVDAVAQPKSGDAAMAETLFNEAKTRMAAGDFATACPKLAESYRLDPGGGTLTALAVCHESLGKTASAWAEFIQVVSDARQAGRADRETFAQQHVDALAPKLSKLTIVVDATMTSLAGLEVKRDGTVIGAAGWGTDAPVDPGSHTVEATATGKKPWSTTIEVGPDGDMETVTVPSLEDAAPAAASGGTGMAAAGGTDTTSDADQNAEQTPHRDHAESSVGSGQRTAGIVVGVAGLVSAALGTYFGVTAISKAHDANGICPQPASCASMDAVNENSDAKSAATIADVLFGGAIAAVGVGAILYFTAPSAPSAEASSAMLRVRPAASPTGVSLMIDGRF